MSTIPQDITSTVIPWPHQERPGNDTLSFLARLHRGENAAVALCRKNGADEFENLGTFQASDYARIADTLRPEITHDSFWTINSTYIPKFYADLPRCEQTQLPICSRKVINLRWLNSCYVDIDCIKVNLSPDEAYSGTIQYMLEHGLSLPTLALFSGRGLWMFWQLRSPVRAFAEPCKLLYRINDNLTTRLKFLGADPQSKDAARICRIPGSVNSKSGTQVYFCEVPNSQPVNLDTFAADLQLPPQKTPVTNAEQKKPKYMRNPARVKGGHNRWVLKRLDLLNFLESRQRVAEGRRHWTLFYFAAISKSAGISHNEIRAEAAEINARLFRPRYTGDKVALSVAGGLATRYNISDATLMRQLGISREVALHLDLTIAKPKYLARPGLRKVQVADRRALVLKYHLQGKSIREISQLLKKTGFSASVRTIMLDVQAVKPKPAKLSPFIV